SLAARPRTGWHQPSRHTQEETMTPPKQVQRAIHSVETLLADFYGFETQVSAADHLVEWEEINAVDALSGSLPEAESNAGVWFIEDPQNMFIGLYLHNDVKAPIEAQCPVTE